MHTTNFLRSTVLSFVPLLCAAVSVAALPAVAQSGASMGAHFQPAVYDGSTQSGWYSFPGQQPKLHFSGDEVRITSRKHSTVLLSRTTGVDGSAAEVSLAKAPISTSSISGLAVLADAEHAVVIGLEGGNVVLWQLDPDATRILARQPVNSSAPLQFRVASGNGSDAQFYWRHKGDRAWHQLGNDASDKVLASWREPLRFGLLLDGPQGSQVTFSNYRAAGSSVAAVTVAPAIMAQSLVGGE